jgi:transcriptional regulator GlxA family with amidase domain
MAIIQVTIVAAVKQRYHAFLGLPGKFMTAMMLLAAPAVGTVPSQLPRQLPWSSSDVYAVLRDVEVIVLRVGLLVAPGFQAMSFAPLSVFETANFILGERHYDVRLVSETGGRTLNSFGVDIATEPLGCAQFDTIVVGASLEPVPATPGIIAFLQNAIGSTRRIASISVAAFMLAEAGILDGRRATTHWYYARDLQSRFPKIKVEADRIFIADGPVWTSAGMTAGVDLALGLVERDIGAEAARHVARMLVIHQRRAGGQSQHSALLELDAKSDRVQDALAFARLNLREQLSVEQLAEAARLSPRQFSRVFRAETGQSPAKAIVSLRLDAARLMLEQGRLPVEAIANETGFGDRECMRRAFLRTSGQTPQAIRNASHPLASI